MKLVLINPVNLDREGLHSSPGTRYPPLSLGIIAALTPDHWDISIIDENIEPFQFIDADLVGITSFTATAPRAFQIAAIYRNKGIPTVMGGIHASMLPDEALNFVDSVVIGEAEEIWAQVITDFESGSLKKTYRANLMDLKQLPKPRHDLFHPSYTYAVIQTARGCPMDCDFCSVTVFNGHRYRQRPVEEVLDEIESIPQDMFFFIDDNLIGYGNRAAQRAIKLFKGMIERGIHKKWFCQASMNFADNEEVLKYAAESGCQSVIMGVESETDETLREVNKSLNLRKMMGGYEEIFRRIHNHGILVFGLFIFGFDSDTEDDLKDRVRYILQSDVDTFQASYLTPLPGTKLYKKLAREKRLLYTNYPEDWVRHDVLSGVVFKPLSMEPEDLQKLLSENLQQLYAPESLQLKFLNTLINTNSRSTAERAYNMNLKYRSIALGNQY